MNKNNVYLCGPIEGLTPKQATEWRNKAKEMLYFNNINTLDPTRRTSFLELKTCVENAAGRIFKADLQDISNSTVILANLSDQLPGKKWGTVCEIAHAHTKNKIIIVIMDKDQFLHPFILQYATEIHHTLEDAIEAVKEYYL